MRFYFEEIDFQTVSSSEVTYIETPRHYFEKVAHHFIYIIFWASAVNLPVVRPGVCSQSGRMHRKMGDIAVGFSVSAAHMSDLRTIQETKQKNPK